MLEDPSVLAAIYEAPEAPDPWSEPTWRACNPALADFRSFMEFKTAARHAQEVPGREGAFRRLYLNQWITQQDHPWIALEAWDRCQTARPADLAGRRAFVGVDLASVGDLTAIVVLLADDDGGFTVAPQFFCPAATVAERSRKDRAPYDLWVKQGVLTATEGAVLDVGVIRARLFALMTEYQVVEIAADPWNLRDRIAEWQRDGLPIVPVEQTMTSLTTAAKAFEALVLSGRLRHDGNPVLRWCVSNCCIDTDSNGNI